MANILRGEIDATLDGQVFTLCLTLGALAELEAALGVPNLLGLVQRFEQGEMKSSDITHIIHAGLKGGGYIMDADAVGRMKSPDGVAGYIDIAARLLKAAFSSAE